MREPLWTNANYIKPSVLPELTELYFWEGKLLSRMHCHHVVFTWRPGQDSGEVTVQLVSEGV